MVFTKKYCFFGQKQRKILTKGIFGEGVILLNVVFAGKKGCVSDRATTLYFSPRRSWTLNILRPSNFFVTLHPPPRPPPSGFFGPSNFHRTGLLAGRFRYRSALPILYL
jgi:hypothetical protein